MDEANLEKNLELMLAQHARTERAVAELQQQFETLLEIMVAMGTLKPGHTALIEKLRRRVEVARQAPVALGPGDDKYTITGEPIDCESRLELCQARCCGFKVLLSRQDLAEGQLAWEIDRPYEMVRAASGYCTYLGTEDARCQNYEHRPATCRSYSCKTDARVWIDFEARIPAPMPGTMIPVHRLVRRGP